MDKACCGRDGGDKRRMIRVRVVLSSSQQQQAGWETGLLGCESERRGRETMKAGKRPDQGGSVGLRCAVLCCAVAVLVSSHPKQSR